MHNKIPFENRLAISIDEAVKVSGLGRSSVYQLMNSGEIETAKIGKRRLVLVASLKKLIEGARAAKR
ncbi:MAG TPA: helix-turn-helix domain-containing protein [Methylocella sp.]|jgi:excisionase family DNA binding protein